jgi:hypothetical protein
MEFEVQVELKNVLFEHQPTLKLHSKLDHPLHFEYIAEIQAYGFPKVGLD